MEFCGPVYSTCDLKEGVWTLSRFPAFWEGTELEESQRAGPLQGGTWGGAPLVRSTVLFLAF